MIGRFGTVLVTGASGFIGRRLVRALLHGGDAVRALSRSHPLLPGADSVCADIADFASVLDMVAGVDTLFHLAGLASVDVAAQAPGETFRINTLGTQNVLEAARLAGVGRVILLSTAHVYGRPARLPLTEDQPPSPGSHYAATKLAADVLALGYHRSYGLAVTVLRPTNVYGPGQTAQAVIPTIVRTAVQDGRIRVRDASVQRDFVFVDDIISGLLATAASKAAIGKELLLASGRAIEVAAIVRHVAGLTGAQAESAQPGAGDCFYASAHRAERLLGWTPQTKLHEGLAQTVAWWREQAEQTVAAAP